MEVSATDEEIHSNTNRMYREHHYMSYMNKSFSLLMTAKHFIHNTVTVDCVLCTFQRKAVLFDEHLVWGDAPLVFNGLGERPHQWTGMINLNNERTSKVVSRGSTALATGSVAPLDL